MKNNNIPLKIKNALKLIKCNENMEWFVPNRKMLNFSIDEFIEFEKYRILEFSNEKLKKTKYYHHYFYNDPSKNNKNINYNQLSIYDLNNDRK